jgi:hypothetical protein
MDNTKFTKGKWFTKLGDVYSENQQDDEIICELQNYKSEQAQANALLISKSPELLDFIRRISGEMLRNDFVLSEKWYEQAIQLVKESTKI